VVGDVRTRADSMHSPENTETNRDGKSRAFEGKAGFPWLDGS
jgi:hypothetical protein